VMCKVSGLVTEARWNTWHPDDFAPYLDVAIEAFGEDRLMFGSDWPVALLAGTYAQAFNLAQDYLSHLGCEAEAKIFGRNAARFYAL
jgi:L-fuconolactonase